MNHFYSIYYIIYKFSRLLCMIIIIDKKSQYDVNIVSLEIDV